VPATDLVSVPARLLAVAGSVVRGLKIQFIEPPHQPQIPLRPAAAHSTRSSATDPKAPPASQPSPQRICSAELAKEMGQRHLDRNPLLPVSESGATFPSELARESGSGSPVIRRARVSLCREMLELPMGGLDDGRAWKVRKLECGTRP
jgi:hypothetical protein